MCISRILENQLIDAQEGVDIGLIVIAQPFLFLYGVTLIVEVLLGNFQRAHAIAFKPERKWKMTCRQCFIVIGALC